MSEVNKVVLWLNSQYRNSGTNAVPEWLLETEVQLSDPNHYLEAEVTAVSLPFSFTQLDAPSNTLPVTVEYGGVTVDATLTFAPGNYSILDLLQLLKEKLRAAVLAAGYQESKLPHWDFTYEAATGACTLRMEALALGINNAWLRLTLHWSQADLLAQFWGFTYEQDTVLEYDDSGADLSTNTVSVEAVNVSPASSLYLRSDSLVQPATSQERLVEFKTTPTNVLAYIPVVTAAGTILHWTGPGERLRLRSGDVKEVQLYFTSTSYAAINFRGLPWRVCLVIREIEPEWVGRMKQQRVEQLVALQRQVAELETNRAQALEQAKLELEQVRQSLLPGSSSAGPEQ